MLFTVGVLCLHVRMAAKGKHLARVLSEIVSSTGNQAETLAEIIDRSRGQAYRMLGASTGTIERVIKKLEAAYPEHAYTIRLAWERDQAPTLSLKLDELKKRARHGDEVAALRAARALAAGDDGAFSALALSSAEQLALFDLVAELRRTHPDNSIEPTIRRLLDFVRAMRPL